MELHSVAHTLRLLGCGFSLLKSLGIFHCAVNCSIGRIQMLESVLLSVYVHSFYHIYSDAVFSKFSEKILGENYMHQDTTFKRGPTNRN